MSRLLKNISCQKCPWGLFSKARSLLLIFIFTHFHIFTFIQAQVNPTPSGERMQGLDQRRKLEALSALNEIKFRSIGPTIMSGRVVDLDVNPDDPTEFYVAYASGGLWHTINNGQSFTPVMDNLDMLFIGDIAVNWSKRTIWVGTGEVNSSRSSYAGVGIYKSSDNGKNWQYLGLPESHHIGKIQLHPTDENTAWVAALGHLYSPNKERGVYKTTDGGKTWKQTLYVDDNTGCVDLDINPSNPSEVYAAMWYRTRRAWKFEESGKSSGIYKSNDGGETWKLLTIPASGFPTGDSVGRIGISVYPQNPQIIYTVLDNQRKKPVKPKKDSLVYSLEELNNLSANQFVELNNKKLDSFLKDRRLFPKYSAQRVKDMVLSNQLKPTALYDYLNINTGFEGTPVGAEVFRSDNGGETWHKTHEADLSIFFTYGYYFAKIYTSPYNPDKIYVLGYSLQVSTDGGKTWKKADKSNVHADHHALWINPKRDSHFINGNDGGVNITYDNGDHWFKANTPPVGQFYSITVDNAKPYNVYGGLQDNGVWYIPSVLPKRGGSLGSGYGIESAAERSIGGGDGMQVQVDPRDNTTTYYGSQFGSYSRTNRLTKEGTKIIIPHDLTAKPLRFNWQTPILLSKHNPEVLYLGSNYLHRSLNKADTMIIMSADLTNGKVPGNVPYGTITTITESPLRFGLIYTGTDDGNIHRSNDGGYTWEQLNQTAPPPAPAKKGKGLPAPDSRLQTKKLWVSRVTASQYKEGRVYVSLSGYRFDNFAPYLYVSDDHGMTWKQIGKELPYEPINVVKEDPKDENIIYVGTDGGLYVSFDMGSSFMLWNGGMPKSVPVHDIAIQARENEIVLGTHGRSIFVAKLEDIQMQRKDPEWIKKKMEKQKHSPAPTANVDDQ